MERLRGWNRALGRVLVGVDAGLAALTCAALAFVVGANAYEIALRVVANRSLHWLYEVNLLLANWIYFLGICLVYHRNRDIVVDFLVALLPLSQCRLYQTIVNLVVVSVLLVIALYGVDLIRLQASDHTMGIGIWNPLFTLPVVLGGIIMALIVINQTLALWLEGEPSGSEGRR